MFLESSISRLQIWKRKKRAFMVGLVLKVDEHAYLDMS